MGKRREASPEEKIAEQRAVIKDAIDTGKTELDLQTESIDVVREVCHIKTLQKLTLKLAPLKTLPKEIGDLAALEQLHIDGNDLTSLPEELGKLGKLKKLVAYSNKLTALPASLGNLGELRELTVWSNELTSIPKSIGKLVKLTEASFKRNKLETLPDELAGLESLEELELDSNELTDVPKDLAGMKKLKRLSLAGNQLTKFPAGLLTLPALVEIDLSENELGSLHADIDRITTLRELNLEQNKLTALPAKLWSLPIVSLKLNQNQLKALPAEVASAPSLIELELWSNPIEGADDQLLRKSKNEILAHFGMWKPKTLRDTTVPADRAAIVKKYAVKLEAFERAAKKGYQVDRTRIPVIVAFVSGEADAIPPGHIDDSERFGELVDAFAPFPEWTFVERRILAFITQEAWRYKMPGHDYYRGFDEAVYRWLEKQLETEAADSTLAADVFAAIHAEGVFEETLVAGALRHMDKHLMRDGATTSFGRFLLAWAPTHEAFVIAQTRSYEEMIALFVRHDRALFARLGDRLLKIEPSDDGTIHVPYEALEHACAVDPARFEPLLLDAIARATCDPCRAEAARVLVQQYPKQRGKALEITKRTLHDISDRKNKEYRFSFAWSGGKRWSDGTAQYIGWALDTFDADVRADVHHLVDNTKVFDLDTAEVLAKKLGQEAIDTICEGLKMTFDDDDIAPHFRRMFGLLAPLDWSTYHELAWALARSEYRQVRQTACLALGRLPAKVVMAKALELLDAKKGHEREAGVLILSLIDDPKAKSTLRGLLATETSDDARDLIVDSVYRSETTCDRAEAVARVAAAKERGKLERPIAKWLDEKKLPKLAWGKTPLDADAVRWLCYRQTRPTELAIDHEARGPLALVGRAKSGPFAAKLLELVMKNGGASAKTRFALALVGALGDDAVVEPLEEIAIDDRNENAVRTLGLLGTMEAARALDRVMKVYRVKYPNVREAAQQAFDSIADRLGVTPFELADTMIPDFGFKDGRLAIAGTKPPVFVTIGDDQKLAYVDAKGAAVKPPKTLAAKPKEALKTLAADLKDAAKQVAGNLEYYLIVRRRWTPAAFTAFFETNPLARSFAHGLVWVAYQAGKITHTFRLTPDGRRDRDGKPVQVGKGVELAIAHPLEMTAADRAAWIHAMTGTTPAFAQLERATFAASDEERARAKSFRFEERELSSMTFKGRAERRGWRRGSVIDSGEVSSYRKLFPHDKIEVFIQTSGMSVSSGFDEAGDVTLKDLFFVRPGAVITGSYTYDEPRDETDDRLIKLGDVPAIVFSEAVADLVAITKQKDDADA